MQVLIVDDDMAIVDVIRQTVDWKKLDIENVFTAYNIETAREILLKYSIDIVISDIEMPRGSGLELLEWIRQTERETEFILLTCHEKFHYATNAVKLRAAEYLLKPFDTVVMEQALRKLIIQIKEKRELQEESTYGKWVKRNRRQLQLDFLNRIMDGSMSSSRQNIEKAIKDRSLHLDINASATLIVSRITDYENDKERMNPGLLMFIVENIHSEILCGNPENVSVIGYDLKDSLVFVTICSETNKKNLQNLCEKLVEEYKKFLSSTLTCCVSRPCRLEEFYDVYHKNLKRISENVIYYGNYFFENQINGITAKEMYVLQYSTMENYLNQKKKIEFMSYLKQRLNEKVLEKKMNEQLLMQAKQEILQVIYAYLAKRDIQASSLFVDDVSNSLELKASQSMINMMRWVSYIIDKTFAYESDVMKSQSIIEKINQYVKDHYQEEIGRNEIAAEFYLAPEYLSKMYKKQTGINLKDYISEYRIEQAKILLKKRKLMVSEVAEAVGFDNFTYFSTMFKKYTGMTPNQYRKKES